MWSYACGSISNRRLRSSSSVCGKYGLSCQPTFCTTAFAGGFATKRCHVTSRSSSGLKLTQISEPCLRIVGNNVSTLLTDRLRFFDPTDIHALRRADALHIAPQSLKDEFAAGGADNRFVRH